MSLMAGENDEVDLKESRGEGGTFLRSTPRWATIQLSRLGWNVFFVALTSERQYEWLVNGLSARHDAFDTGQ